MTSAYEGLHVYATGIEVQFGLAYPAMRGGVGRVRLYV